MGERIDATLFSKLDSKQKEELIKLSQTSPYVHTTLVAIDIGEPMIPSLVGLICILERERSKLFNQVLEHINNSPVLLTFTTKQETLYE